MAPVDRESEAADATIGKARGPRMRCCVCIVAHPVTGHVMRLVRLLGPALLGLLIPVAATAAEARPAGAAGTTMLAVDGVGTDPSLIPAADLLSLALVVEADGSSWLRVAFLDCSGAGPIWQAWARRAAGAPAPASVDIEVRAIRPKRPELAALRVRQILQRTAAGYALQASLNRDGAAAFTVRPGDPDAVWLALPPAWIAGCSAADPLQVTARTLADREVLGGRYPPDKVYEAHCALVLHGNQGLGYTDVFHGRPDDPEGSGFDEALQVHEGTGVPGNFHLAGTLQAAAEWSAHEGDPQDFNGWLTAGVTAGWAGLLTSAYAQHIMPFVQDAMNDWAVDVETQMVSTRYGYFPTVAWVPERVWLNTSGYPSAGVNDWIGDNWQPHGVQGVILDDDVHLAGHDNHRIHFLSGNGLRLIPRDRSFTGDIVGGNGQAALDILTGLAGSGVGQYRIAVFAEDWESVAEMGSWAGTTPYAKETYDWFVGKCATESAWLHTWKLADALANSDFDGDTFDPTPGTYWEIGGTDGYGGGDNGWYTHWAGFVPYVTGGDGNGDCAGSGGSCADYGTLWNDAYLALMAAPDNNVSQAGWYVLMTNLHETAWHDGLVGPISGWEHKYSAHVKNARMYAEAAHWANGEYATTTAAYLTDIDGDGYDECVIHNDHLFGVIEGIGGRLTNLFVKGPGYDDSAIGVDNAYWSGTEGDFNDDNHVGAFSEVGPNYQHDGYQIEILSGGGPIARLRLSHAEVTKEIALATGDSFLDVVYRVGPATHWIQSGFSPSLVDLTWNAQLDRIWAPDASYMGQRNPHTGIAAAWVVGSGGAVHQRDFSGTLMKGDEIRGSGVFQCRLFAGPSSPPDGSGNVAELQALAAVTLDSIGPAPLSAEFYPASTRLRVTFDQPADPATADPGGVGVDEDGDGAAEVVLGGGTTVSETVASFVLTYELDPATATALAALDPQDLRLLLDADAVRDAAGNGNLPVGAAAGVSVTVVQTQVTIDGHLETGEWSLGFVLPDSSDSAWTAANEIDDLHVSWDDTYLYLALDGLVSSNSWLIYLDVDPGSGLGQTDLTAIDVWERGAVFTAPGFAADFQYGCYQHQSVWDGDGFWQLLSPTATAERSSEILSAFDSFHAYGDAGGSELAIPWNTLYGLGDGAVPPGAQIALVASLCWDPEPDGMLGGDSAPDDLAAALPVIDNVWTLPVDGNGDGRPDRLDLSPVPELPAARFALGPAVPNPFNPRTTLSFVIDGSGPMPVDLAIYDLRGRRVATLLARPLTVGRHEAVWEGVDDRGRRVAAGTYICSLRCCGQVVSRPLSLIK